MSVSVDLQSEILDITADLEIVLRGEDGKSAYEVAVKNGFVGTEQEWLDSLKGEADRAEAYTQEAREYRNAAQSNAILAGNQANAARIYRDETQAIRDGFAPEVANATAAIQAEKEEAEQKKLLVDEAAENARLDRVQADADAAEVRYLYNETVVQKNVATDAAERARRYTYDALNWVNISNKPTTRDGYGITDVPKVDGTDATGTWDIDITGDAATVNGLTVETAVPVNAVFTDTTYDTMTAEEATTGTGTTARVITAKVLADKIAEAIASLVDSSPAALDTLNELAAALGNDPNFATTMATALGNKLDKAGGVVTGDLTVNGTFTADVTGDVTGNADTATALETPRTINGTSFDGSANIVTDTWGTSRTITIMDADGTNTGTPLSMNGSTDVNLLLPATIKASTIEMGSCTVSNTLDVLSTITGYEVDATTVNVSGNMSVQGAIYGSVSGSATSATNDKNGDDITTTYLKLSGGTVSGDLTVTGDIIGDVTGNAGTATKISGKTIPVVSSFDSSTGTLALTSLS